MANSSEHGLFASLHVWAKCQDENLCTEGLIFLLRLMLADAAAQAIDIIGWLTDGLIAPSTPANSIKISGQVVSDSGRPDIEICAQNKKAWIEVKVDSKVGLTQLERYRNDLFSEAGEVRLILLSRHHEPLTIQNQPDCSRLWLDLSSKLEDSLSTLLTPSKISYLLADYLQFLGTRQMKLNCVGETASSSISEVATLLSQLELACTTAGIKPRFKGTKTCLGYWLNYNHCLGWIGFNLTDPQWVFYSTEDSIDEAKIVPELMQQCSLPGGAIMGKHWTNSMDLVNCTDYLHASAADQVEYIKRHLIEASLAAFRSMLPPQV